MHMLGNQVVFQLHPDLTSACRWLLVHFHDKVIIVVGAAYHRLGLQAVQKPMNESVDRYRD